MRWPAVRGRVSLNTEPRPFSPHAWSQPPCSRASSSAMARPRPVPPVVRARDGSARQNRSKTSCSSPGAEPDAVIADGDGGRLAVRRHGHHHVASLTVLHRVDEQVAQDPLHPAPVHLGHAGLHGQPELDAAAAALRELLRVVRAPAHDVAQVRGLGVERRDVRVVPADLEQVGEQGLEPLDLALQQLGAARGRRVKVFPRLEEDLRGHPDRRHRGPQLVRDVGDELALHLGQFLKLVQLLLEAGGHVVERGGERGEVVGAADDHPLLKLAGGQPLRGPRRVPHRQHHPPGHQ